MKRIKNIYDTICSLENLYAAERCARRGKSGREDIAKFGLQLDENILLIHNDLVNKTYTTSAYKTFKVWEPKERLVYWLPYRDQIVHWAIMLQLRPMFDAMFTTDTYACIKGRGIHAASYALRNALKDVDDNRYCLKVDIQKFYPSVDHDILKALLRRKIKDQDLLDLLDEIIDSADGLPIGNYLSIYLGNFYLAYFDHWVKEELGVRNYFRYTDDMVITAADKPTLHRYQAQIKAYLQINLKLKLNSKRQIFPVESRLIDFVGYPTSHKGARLRPEIKRNIFRMLKYRPNLASISSYHGWLKHCNSKNLQLTINEKIQRLGDAVHAVGRQNKRGRHIRQKTRHPILPDRPKQTGSG